MSTVVRNAFLSGVIASPKGLRLDKDNTFRRYRTFVRTSTTVGGNLDARNASIYYEVGRAMDTIGKALSRPSDDEFGVEASYPTNTILAEDFVGLAKKYTNFSASFEYTSLAGVVERLARGLAAASVFEGVTSDCLRGGAALAVDALGTYDGPVNSLTDTVYIPRLVNNTLTGDVFSVLANAVAGEGSRVATDVVELDATTRQPLVHTVGHLGLPGAIVDALRLLGSNMVACDQGPLFALAVTRGLHRVLSVVGHTDEGGITRALLRTSHFAPPFGGIHYGLELYAGLPALQYNHAGAIASYVDGIALVTAGLVVHADPGCIYNGEWFPTFYNGTSYADPVTRPGSNTPGTPAMGARIHSQLLSSVSSFYQEYIRGLGRVFAAEGDTSVAIRFQTAASHALPANARHLQLASISPWFWVEPTGLIPHDFLGSRAEDAGIASFSWKDTTRTRPAWEDIQLVGEADNTFSAYNVRSKSARQCWFLLHWLNHPLNGLGALKVRQLDPNAIIHPGACVSNPDVRDRLEADLPLTDYLWVRGQSPFCAPGEFLNLTCTMGVLARHLTFDDDGVPIDEHLPTRREFLDTAITIEVGRPVGIATGKSNTTSPSVRRARTRAGNELAASRRRAALFGRSDVGEMPTLSTAPVMGRRIDPAHDSLLGGAGGGASGLAPVRSAAPAHSSSGRGDPRGVQVDPTVHNMPLRGPQLARGGPAGFGGGDRKSVV